MYLPTQIYKMSLNPPSSMTPAPSHAYAVALFTVLCTLLCLALFLYRVKATSLKKTELHRLPPGPAGLPVLGSMHGLVLKRPVFRWIHRLLKDMNTNVLCLRFGAVHVVVVACPVVARDVLRKNDAVFASRPLTFASRLFSFGYRCSSLSPYGEQWKKMRRVLTSEILSMSMEQRLKRQRAEEADHLIRFVYNQCNTSANGTNSGIVDVRHVAQHFCGNMVRSLMFGTRHFFAAAVGSGNNGSRSPGPEEVAHVDALFTLLNNVYSFSISDYTPTVWTWIVTALDLDGHKKAAKSVMSTLNRLHDPIIQERIHEWHSLRKHGDNREARDFLDVLVSLEDSQGRPLLSFDEIKAQTAEIMFASVDNPSNAVEWALAEMMNKPEVMHKAVHELNNVVGKDRLVQESDIPQLNYLKACLREAFRLHPYHAFNLPHVAMKDTIVSGYLIPKGCHVLLSRVGLGRNSDAWDAPLQFQPERHLMIDNKSEHAHVVLTEPDLRFISFSAGRRGCPAVSLASSVTMMLFARLLQGFMWTKPPYVHAIELKESTTSLALAEPLFLQALPRLPMHLYGTV
ncbi:tyrosine N-monooxygenase-like [Sorghum bicolor]|nr:tyrosine N-monooxygenase-like [Sorghum bicolor]|eukprot:XP_002450980.2 tyrosine N-monooxygenase-like [Sorghum bicolor]